MFAVKTGNVGAQLEFLRVPNFPPRMFDPVLTAPSAHTGVAPIMFGDEIGVRASRNNLWFAARRHLERFPFAAASPRILNAQSKIDMFDLVLHREREIIFSIKCAGDQGDGATRNQFAHKDHAASPRVGGFLAHVEAQVHFFEIAMQRNRQPENTSIEKEKADNADKGVAVFKIEFGSRRHEWRNDRRIDREVEHGEVSPVGREERFHAEIRRFIDRRYRVS